MAEVRAIQNGMWSDPLIWNTGSLPTENDTVHSNNFTVTIDVPNPKVIYITNDPGTTASLGGRFFLTHNCSLTADIYNTSLSANSTNFSNGFVLFTSGYPYFCSVHGNFYGGNNITSFRHISTGTVSIYGNLSSSIVGPFSRTLNVENSGTANIFGNIIANESIVIGNSSSFVNIIGEVRGGYGFGSTNQGFVHGIYFFNANASQGRGRVNVLGNVVAGTPKDFLTFDIFNHGISHETSLGVVSIVGNISGAGENHIGRNSSTGLGIWNGGLAYTSGAICGDYTDGIRVWPNATLIHSGNIYGGNTDNIYGVQVSNGSFHVLGNINGNESSNSVGLLSNSNTQSNSVTGNVVGGKCAPGVGASTGLQLQGSSNVNIFGNSFGASEVSFGLRIDGSNIVTIFGNSSGGYGSNSWGSYNNGTNSYLKILGDSLGGIGSSSHGTYVEANRVNATYVRKATGNGWGIGSSYARTSNIAFGAAYGVFNASRIGRCYVEFIESGPRGMFPVAGYIYLTGSEITTSVFRDSFFKRTSLFTTNTGSIYQPLTSDVRLSTVYSGGTLTGSLNMPPPNKVNFGVPVDNTSGVGTFDSTLAFTIGVSAIGIKGSLGARIKRIPTIESTEVIINNLNVWIIIELTF